jgi:hypothetical protein
MATAAPTTRPACVGHEIWPEPRRPEIVDERADGRVAVAGPWHVVQVRAEQPVEKRVARGFVFRRRRREAAVINGQMTGQPKLCSNRRNLPLAVRLHDTA